MLSLEESALQKIMKTKMDQTVMMIAKRRRKRRRTKRKRKKEKRKKRKNLSLTLLIYLI
jgi:hypothetical protein